MTDFYQSPADKMRLEVLLNSLLEGRLNLAILGHDEVALAHYARLIHEHLKTHGQLVELWSSAQSEQLVERFNQILSELTLKQAQDKIQTSAQRLYLIFPDTQSIADFELQLLARLVNGFPASNINVILLINRLEPFERKLQAFGKNLLQWILESEHPIPERMTQIEVRSDEQEPHAPMTQAPVLKELDAPANDGDHPREALTSTARPHRQGKGMWLVGLALAISLAAFAVMRWSSGNRPASAIETPTASSASGPVQSEAAANSPPVGDTVAPASVGMSSSSQQPVPPQESLTSGKEELVAPAVASPSPAPAPAPAAASQSPPTSVSAPSAPSVALAPSTASGSAANGSRSKADQDWVRKELKAGQWVLQLAAMESLEEAQSMAMALPFKDEVRVLMAPRNGSNKYYFIVIRGPIDSKEAAESLMKSTPALAKAWMRSAKSMKTQFEKP